MSDNEDFHRALRNKPEAFTDAVRAVREGLTNSVMAAATTLEDRDALLAEYHALERVVIKLKNQLLN